MEKKLSLLFLTILFSLPLFGQNHGNEWINYNQQYFKFPVLQTGFHKITYQDLVSANIPVSTFTPNNIQIFGREQEVPLLMEAGTDNSFDSGDYFLFYAEKNDGWQDSSLYSNPEGIGNPYYSLYNDTVYYFFTWNASPNNKRFTIDPDVNYSNYAPSNYILWKEYKEYHEQYFEGRTIANISSSLYVNGEGYVKTRQTGPHSLNIPFNTNHRYVGSDAPEVQFLGKSFSRNAPAISAPPFVNHHTRWRITSPDTTLMDTTYLDIKSIDFRTSLRNSILNNGTTTFQWVDVGDLPSGNDTQGFSYAELTFPKAPNFSGTNAGKFKVPKANGQTKAYYTFTNVGMSNPVFLVLGDSPKQLLLTANGANTYEVLVPNDLIAAEQTVVFGSLDNTISVNPLSLATTTGYFTNYLSQTPDSALLFVYHSSLENNTIAYENYRQSPAGGGYQVIKADIAELYLQFGGGVPKHINGVRRWAKYIYDNSVQKPAGLFIIGKGVREAPSDTYPFQTAGTRGNSAFAAQSLVPSFGQPSSDVAITASWVPNNWTPFIPTGRISVKTEDQLANYLNKVKEFDLAQNQNDIYDFERKDWQKQVLHFGGGTNATEQTVFQNYLNQMEAVIEDSLFAGNVTKLYKNNSDPFDPQEYNEITNRLSSGVSLINFFGHANPATNGFEINVEEPRNWNNQGKYPIVIANTCLNGNIFHRETAQEESTSEKFVRAENAGAIAFISSVFLGFSNTLYNYTSGLYRQFSRTGYGLPLGEQIRRNISILQGNINDYVLESNTLQMSLNGDPMIRLNWHEKPEIDLTADRLSYLPEKFDLSLDSIELIIDIRNLGRAVTDSINVEIIRNFPSSNIDSVYLLKIPRLNYQQKIHYKLPLQANIGAGLNIIKVNVDIPSFIEENYDELFNNTITKNLFINIEGIQPVLPRKYAVVPKDSVVLKASTIDPIAVSKTYRFEIDTTDLFNSPVLRYQNITGPGGVKEAFPGDWRLSSNGSTAPLVCTDSTVYFWRVAIQEPNPDWRVSSFQYIPGKSGWGQDHYFQFEENSFTRVKYDRTTRNKTFIIGDSMEVQINSYGSNYGTAQNNWLLNGLQQEYEICQFQPQIHVGVIDPVTLTSWGTSYGNSNPNHNFGNYNNGSSCRARVEKTFIFSQNNAGSMNAFQNMVQNEVPDSFYIVIYFPYYGARFDLWNNLSPSMFATLQALGFDSMTVSQQNTNVALFVQKGFPNSAVQVLSPNGATPAVLKTKIGIPQFTGQETSVLAGPAKKWSAFYWNLKPLDNLQTDSTYLEIDLYGPNKNFVSTLQLNLPTTASIHNFDNIVDAAQYPFIKLRAVYLDTVNQTPGQLDYWHLLYEEVPEMAIDGSSGFLWTGALTDTLFEGKDALFSVDIRNISEVPSDSLLVHYFIEDENQVRHYLPYPRQDSLRSGDFIRDTLVISTLGYRGNNSLWVEVNPYVGPNNLTDQPEEAHFNNLLQVPFPVRGDGINPLLDVTFDGRHILNGDVINPNSEIIITLKDENEFQIMDSQEDTANFKIYLTSPNGTQMPVFFNNGGVTQMQFIPATAQNKRCRIVYPAEFLKDGKYILSVQGLDKSGNLSGDNDYRVTFEVIRESSITYMMNYPNPFSTSTRFVFTLTGTEIPDDLIIQIMTVNGRIVREITEAEFGPIYIGRNISEFAWDGTDEFGDPLANGVYLYRVKMRVNGEEIKHKESGADSHFKEEFGKMYLMR